MKSKLATILCLSFLFSPKNFSHAKTGNFALGVHMKTSYVRNADQALRDYYLFNGAFKGTALNDHEWLFFKNDNKGADILSQISKVPLIAGINLEYSIYFTEKFGLSFLGNWGIGNCLVMNINSKKYNDTITGLTQRNFPTITEKSNDYCRKISVMDLGFDVRLKYDIVNSCLDFNDYSRNTWVLSASLGFKNNWLLLRSFCALDGNEIMGYTNSETGPNKKDNSSSDRINCWFPGAVLGVDVIFPWNLGLGVDVCYFFKNLFTKSDKLAAEDQAFATKYSQQQCITPQYRTICHLIQGGLRVYYDFGPFINNHEAPSEVDIEKW